MKKQGAKRKLYTALPPDPPAEEYASLCPPDCALMGRQAVNRLEDRWSALIMSIRSGPDMKEPLLTRSKAEQSHESMRSKMAADPFTLSLGAQRSSAMPKSTPKGEEVERKTVIEMRTCSRQSGQSLSVTLVDMFAQKSTALSLQRRWERRFFFGSCAPIQEATGFCDEPHGDHSRNRDNATLAMFAGAINGCVMAFAKNGQVYGSEAAASLMRRMPAGQMLNTIQSAFKEAKVQEGQKIIFP
uniref:CMP/dCMP-type deaminase domain-containing protein n=1 Tax=Steinernema glaseri TaxID=37863 RepID=A0A1I7XXK2_9BILA